MFAAVDLGSNSFRLHVGLYDGEAIRIVKSARDPIRLAAGLDNEGNLTGDAMQKAVQCLANFKSILDGYKLDAVRVVATNTLRIAKNGVAFLPEAERAIGYPIEIISGEEEGRLIYMGVASTLDSSSETRLVVDIGGGSTELILGRGHDVLQVESFSIGTVGQAQAFIRDAQIDAAGLKAAVLSARSVFEDGAEPFRHQQWSHVYGSSGTIRTISDALSKNAIGDRTLSLDNLEALKVRLLRIGHVSQVDLLGIKPERVTPMIGGLTILIGIMQELGIASLTAVDAGLRMGVLWDLQLRATRRDRREQSVLEFMHRFQVNEDRASRVATLATTLYSQLKPQDDTFAKYLYWGGLLHEIGLAVSHTGYHKHAAYMLENADLPGFTAREQRFLSTLVLAQKGNLRKVSEALRDADFTKAVLALRLAITFMHARIDTEVSGLRLKMKSRIELEFKRELAIQHPTVLYWIEKEKGWWSEVGMEMTVKSGG